MECTAPTLGTDSYPSQRRCAVCEGARVRKLHRQQFQALTEGALLEGYDVVSCETCGFCFADRVPDQAAFDQYYEAMSKYENTQRDGRESPYDRARLQEVARVARQYLPSLQSRILEIGCANGLLLSLLKQAGYACVTGVDPSPTSARLARELYGVHVVPATFSRLNLAPRSADFIILVGVLEHVRDLPGALHTLSNLLSDAGRLYFVLPDASRYSEGRDAPFQEFSVEHINYFGRVSLSNLLVQRGFVEIGYEEGFFEVGYRTSTPVLHAVFERATASQPIVHDTATCRDLASYVAQSLEADRRIHRIVAELAQSGQPILVWGTGSHTLRLLATSKLNDARISAFVDSNPHYQGKQLHGVSIIAPSALHGHDEPILISSWAYQSEIETTIRAELRLSNPVIKLYDL
jgi:SAM-dependent methyltransferase